MKTSEKFLKFAYKNVDFYFPQSVIASGDFTDKINYENIFKINIDKIAERFFNENPPKTTEKKLILTIRPTIENSDDNCRALLVKSEPQFLLLSTREHEDITLELKYMKAVSGILKDFFIDCGIIAVTFINKKPGFIIDVQKFIQKTEKKHAECPYS